MNIYSCVDSNNIDKIYVLYYSIYKNTKDFNKLNFYVITDSNNIKEVPNFLKDRIKIKSITFNNKWEKVLQNFNKYFYNRSSWCKSDMNFARFFIFELFPEIDKVIYLDWDMIVQTDIFQLKSYYDKDFSIVANLLNNWNVKENIIDEKIKINKKLLDNVEIKLNKVGLFKNKSFNSGFFIVSKKTFGLRKIYDLINRLIILQKENNIFKFGTQVIMNVLLDNLEFVDYRWNTNRVTEDSFIIHWCGHRKPWVSNDNIWLKYFDELYPKKKEEDIEINKKINKKVLIYMKN